ncbi:MAG: NAD-binding protein [Actinomycetota bacterium]|nr:NAD-binding protein [Actinomycetota bacterium]MDP9005805.1 NAD-binding protein [Actinomycetota bacterium]
MRVVIAGGGNVGKYIATDLQGSDHDVLVLEQSLEVVERARASGEHVGVEFKVADACEVSALVEAKLETADVVAAVTGDDEDNLVVSLLAKQEFGVPRVIARVNHPKNEWLFNETWGVDVAVSTPHLLTALVEEAVTVGTLVRLLQFEGGKARLVEVTLAEASPAAGATVVDLNLPRDSTVVAIIRADHLVVPRGDTLLLAADEVLVLVTPDSESAVRSALVGT